jgi:hypothetical protein
MPGCASGRCDRGEKAFDVDHEVCRVDKPIRDDMAHGPVDIILLNEAVS